MDLWIEIETVQTNEEPAAVSFKGGLLLKINKNQIFISTS